MSVVAICTIGGFAQIRFGFGASNEANSPPDLLAEAGFNFFPKSPDFWIRLIFFKLAVEHGFLIRVDGRASKQVRFLDFANALQDFAAVCLPQLGQFIKNSRFAHGVKLVLAFVLGEGNSRRRAFHKRSECRKPGFPRCRLLFSHNVCYIHY
jgi:hypothetical protein